MWHLLLFIEIFLFFILFFYWLQKESIIHNIVNRTYTSLENAAIRRERENRKNFELLKKRKGVLYKIEQRILYSGLHKKIPFLTPYLMIGIHIIILGFYVPLNFLGISTKWSFLITLSLECILFFGQNLLINHNYNKTNEELLKFLDFLGNYSITQGEITIVLKQISNYVEEPLKTALEECYYEARTSGNTSLALLTLEAKIQHPKFKEMIRNIEITMRYSADLTKLVEGSRHSLRGYMRMRIERKAMIKEGWINLLLLGAMVVVILKVLEDLIQVSIQSIMFHTLIGNIALFVIGFILVLFYLQIQSLNYEGV